MSNFCLGRQPPLPVICKTINLLLLVIAALAALPILAQAQSQANSRDPSNTVVSARKRGLTTSCDLGHWLCISQSLVVSY